LKAAIAPDAGVYDGPLGHLAGLTNDRPHSPAVDAKRAETERKAFAVMQPTLNPGTIISEPAPQPLFNKGDTKCA
jgi:hypothetical protein